MASFALKLDLFGCHCSIACSTAEEVEWAAEKVEAVKPSGRHPCARGAKVAARGKQALAPCGWCGSLDGCACLEALFPGYSGARDHQVSSASSESTDVPEDTSQLGSPDDVSLAGDVGSSSSSSAAPADFSGSWVLNRVEGDFEALMADAGVSWAIRKMAKSMNYGAGLVTQTVEQDGNSLAITFQNGPGQAPSVMRLVVGGGVQTTSNEDGSDVTLQPRWEDHSLCLTGKTASGSNLQPARRFLSGEEMVIESRTSQGLAVRRYFAKA